MRTCIACKAKRAKNDMVRIVRDQEGEVYVDPKGKVRGRGANLCEKVKCLHDALDKNILKIALRLDHSISKDHAGTIIKQFEDVLYERELRKGKKKVVIRISKKDLNKK